MQKEREGLTENPNTLESKEITQMSLGNKQISGVRAIMPCKHFLVHGLVSSHSHIVHIQGPQPELSQR